MLVGLERLVDLEEVLDLGAQLRCQVVDVVGVLPARLLGRNADELGVLAGFVAHVQHTERPGLDPDTRVHGVLEQHQRIQWIAVAAERLGDEAVVSRVRGGGEQPSIEEHATALVVDLVLVATAPRDLDHDEDAPLGGRLGHAAIIPHRENPPRVPCTGSQ